MTNTLVSEGFIGLFVMAATHVKCLLQFAYDSIRRRSRYNHG